MLQFYFLAVLLNILGGYSLVIAGRSGRPGLLSNLESILVDARSRLSMGILSLVVGVFKLVSPMRGDLRVIGDLFPALTVLLVGAVLLLEIRASAEGSLLAKPEDGERAAAGGAPVPTEAQIADSVASTSLSKRRRFGRLLLSSGTKIGYIAILAGLVHFLFPLELFL